MNREVTVLLIGLLVISSTALRCTNFDYEGIKDNSSAKGIS